MDRGKIPKAVKSVRKDLSEWLWHLVRRDNDPKKTIRKIVTERTIRGGQDMLTKETVICFSEAPLRELINQNPVLSQNGYTRLSLFGIGFRKSWVYERRGRPVIYQPNSELSLLPQESIWRHVEFDLSKPVDYTWQREWRIKANELKFSLSDAIVLVEDTYGLENILWKIHVDVDAKRGEVSWYAGVFKEFDFIPSEFADIEDDRSIEVCISEDYDDAIAEDDYDKLDIIGP